MFGSNYKTAVRQIVRNRFHSFLNITGLSVGIAFTLLICVYAWSEWRVNRGLKDYKNQYILTSEWKDPNLGYPLATLGPLAKALKENYPALVANYYRFDGVTIVVGNGDKTFREELQMGDSTFLPMYGFPLIHGDPRTALDRPFTVVITDDRAIKFFGTTDIVGKDILIANNSGERHPFRITGVLQKPPMNSVTRLTTDNTIFVSIANLAWFGRNMDWDNNHIAGYLELQPGVVPRDLAGPVRQLIGTNADPVLAANLTAHVMPLTDYYLQANNGAVDKMVVTLGLVAVFILGMAMINFVNLSIGRSDARMKEIGIRKVLGGPSRQLRRQFLAESILLALLSTLIALLFYTLLKPVASQLLHEDFPGLSALPFAAWLLIPASGVLVGWLAGIYPAILLSATSTIGILKGKPAPGGRHASLRKGLVGFQFATAMTVMVGAILISEQVGLFFSDRLGYDKEYILTAQLPRDWSPQGVERMERIRAEFATLPQVSAATLSFEIPNGENSGDVRVIREGGDPTKPIVAQSLVTDAHYAATYGIPMAAGVFLQYDPGNGLPDSTRVVLNETAARALGWKRAAAAIGQRVRITGTDRPFTVSGVVRDFHFDAMGVAIPPEVFATVNTWNIFRYFSFKLKPGHLAADIGALQRTWSRLMPGAPFEYRFMDDALRSVYDREVRLRKAASTATVLALAMVLLGLIGLVAGSVRRRTREMAIRKVIGAGVPAIIGLFLREYLPLLLVSGSIAWPAAGWLMHRWLNNYATRISITPWPFVLATVSLGVIVLLLILAQTLPAARANPTRSLHAE